MKKNKDNNMNISPYLYMRRTAYGLFSLFLFLFSFSAHAAFSDGMILPTGTTTILTDSLTTYFFPTILATAFQSQVVQIFVVLAAVYVMWYVVRLVINAIRGPGH